MMSVTNPRSLSARTDLLVVAKGVLAGTVEIVQGCRDLVRLGSLASVSSYAAFRVIRAVESETDDYPLGDRREGYSAEILERLDKETAEYVARCRPAVLVACSELIEELETHPL